MKRAPGVSMHAPVAAAALVLLLASVLSAGVSATVAAAPGLNAYDAETAESAESSVDGVFVDAAGVDLEPMEARLLSLLNAERVSRSLQPLQLDATLEWLARDRSRDMAARNYFSHVTPEGTMVFSTMDQMQIPYKLAGENLARNSYPPDQSPDVAHHGFMNSPGHAENDYDPNFNNVGIGVAVADDGIIYFTELFAALDY